MSLSDYGIRQVWYGESYYVNGHGAGVNFGIGTTVSGYLTVFQYNSVTDDMEGQLIWPVQLSSDESHMVAATFDGGNAGLTGTRVMRMYVDGEPHSDTFVGGVPHSNHAAIGGLWLGYDSKYNQLNAHWVDIGQFSYWHRILSPTAISDIYEAGQEWNEYEVERATKVLDFIGWPSSWRDGLSLPHSTYQKLDSPNWEVGVSALELIQRAISSVDGLIFVAADGVLTYQRMTDRNINADPTLVFSEGSGTAIDDSFAYTVDDNDIVNVITATTRSGLAFRASNEASIAAYGERTQSVDSDLLHPSDVVKRANQQINRYKTPILRCPVITVDVAAAPDSMLDVFDLELGDNVMLADLPSTAPGDEMTVTIESISWEIDSASRDWKVTFDVSPGNIYTHTRLNYCELDNTSLGG